MKLYNHDCTACVFLCQYTPPLKSPRDEPAAHDLYYCASGARSGSVLARYGDNPSEYLSMGLEMMIGARDVDAPLAKAAREAIVLLHHRFTH